VYIRSLKARWRVENQKRQTGMDEKVFKNLFEDHYTALCRFASGYLADQDTAEEIVQQLFINLWNQRQTIDPEKQIKSYLFTAVKNRCLNHIRDIKKFRNYYLDVEAELEIPVAEKDIVSEKELEQRIADALEKLPAKCREVFELCRFEEMKYHEVAQKLDISQKTVEAQMSKALRILREELKDLWFLNVLYYFFC
jgi:RNA polymerase sigma-70 factor, ECF subfamily